MGARVLSSSSFVGSRAAAAQRPLFFLVHAAAFFAAFFFENESVLLRNLRRDIGLDRLVLVHENVEVSISSLIRT